jgi:hypothetical protein
MTDKDFRATAHDHFDLEGPSFISEARFHLQPLHYLALRETKALERRLRVLQKQQ